MKSEVAITFTGEPVCLVQGGGHIQQVLMNLVQNAVDAMEGMAAPQIRFHLAYAGARAVIDVRDTGPGGAGPRSPQTIFDPFFTTKEVGRGTGLGRSISHKIVENMVAGSNWSKAPGRERVSG
ncbi:MAG: ATP-binding protein [Paracoccaceae bacterium]